MLPLAPHLRGLALRDGLGRGGALHLDALDASNGARHLGTHLAGVRALLRGGGCISSNVKEVRKEGG